MIFFSQFYLLLGCNFLKQFSVHIRAGKLVLTFDTTNFSSLGIQHFLDAQKTSVIRNSTSKEKNCRFFKHRNYFIADLFEVRIQLKIHNV